MEYANNTKNLSKGKLLFILYTVEPLLSDPFQK